MEIPTVSDIINDPITNLAADYWASVSNLLEVINNLELIFINCSTKRLKNMIQK